MQCFPITQMRLDEALQVQFRLVDLIHRHFSGAEFLQAGDFGMAPDFGRPRATARAEAVLAELFDAEDAALVWGAGSGAIRACLMTLLAPGDQVLVHDAPIYTTTRATFRAMGLVPISADFNDLDAVRNALRADVAGVYVQHSRQLLADHYDLAEVVQTARQACPDVPIVVDDNYAALQMPRIGCQVGADCSAFSLFKVLGPPGVGCVVGRARSVRPIREAAGSGGSVIQGPQAMDVLRSIVYAPVMLAIQAQVVDELVARLKSGEVPGVVDALVSNHQERTALVELAQPIAEQAIVAAERHGATPYPVGSSSRYEVTAMVYRLSRTMIAAEPSLAARFLRINPFRASADTVIRVLQSALADVTAAERA